MTSGYIKTTKTYIIKNMIDIDLSEEIEKTKTKQKKLNYLKKILINKLNLRGTIKEVGKKTEDHRISYRKIRLLYLIIVLLNIDDIYYKGKKHQTRRIGIHSNKAVDQPEAQDFMKYFTRLHSGKIS